MCLGIPGKVIEIRDDAALLMGKVDFGGVRKEICLAYTPEVRLGDFVIVHVGFAISQVDEAEALKTLEILGQMGAVVAAELETMGPGMLAPAVVSDDGTPGSFAAPSSVPVAQSAPSSATPAAPTAQSSTAPATPAAPAGTP
jgi:hydrogenase expression/formation protein HypC